MGVVGSPRNLPKRVVPAVARSPKSLFGLRGPDFWRSGHPDCGSTRQRVLEGGHRGVYRGRPSCAPGRVDPADVAIATSSCWDPKKSSGCCLGGESSVLELPLDNPSERDCFESRWVAPSAFEQGQSPRLKISLVYAPVRSEGPSLSSLLTPSGRQSFFAGPRRPAVLVCPSSYRSAVPTGSLVTDIRLDPWNWRSDFTGSGRCSSCPMESKEFSSA
jgi:hypothetical protein